MKRPSQTDQPTTGQAPGARHEGAASAAGDSKPPARANLLPDFCSLPMVLGVVVYAELLAILITLTSPQPLATFWTRMGPLSVFVQLIALLSAALMCAARPRLGHIDARLGVLGALVIIIGSSAAITVGATLLIPPEMARRLFPKDGLAGLMIRALCISAIVGALFLRYLYLHQQWRFQVEAVANARFKTLQAKIRPHFLFNSMNTIASLTRSNPKLAEETVLDLADLFRASLATEADTATLSEEFELARRYLNIEQLRLGERMRVDWDIQQAPGEALLPPLILQPLVENAVYHGISPSLHPGFIRIGANYHHGQIHVTIVNSLPLAGNHPTQRHQGHQMAIANVTQRLEAMFPGTASLRHGTRGQDYQVRLAFPHPWRRA
ncbi:sensor histidine kinase [Thiorhodovibrio frisius]|uniref:Histidine kinase n=1 Tax=Thiorhodovibrio frisius TaxID=631362 RepID=H8Z6C4_9GAMM|nr:histidine kinase [Thiorhodovibrio frisius]EIC20708.1 Histidine kinase [Thiorhodovibrio frisius]WPL21456.1 Sensor histidine kinase YehU [Thiorhodovibrio frisius]